jgi:outer membrane protein assembly factor BamB
MRRLPSLAPFASLAALAALASCHHATSSSAPAAELPLAPASPWPKFRGDAFQDGAGTVHAKATGGAFWAFQTGKGVFSSPVVGADGTVYVGSADRTFYAINPDGTLKWKLLTGEIIDSAALLDDRGHVYFGSGDSKLRALDAQTGSVLWTMQADDPSVNQAFINWFEGNVGIGPGGDLYVPNDNFFVYAVDRDTGAAKWKLRMPDQTWSLPAVDPASGALFVGNNNMVALLGDNTFCVTPDGHVSWSTVSMGTVAASPMLTKAGDAVVGSFDGYVYDYAQADGAVRWKFATRDHVYASAAREPDGTIVAASADGTIYGLDPATGAQKWAFDTPEPIRASPSIDADGNVYFGDGDGRLYVLGPDGKLRWSMRLIDGDRDDLNASPALANDAVILAGESGQVFSVPYDWCLRPENAGDGRCATSAPAPADGASLVWDTSFGAQLAAPPTSVDANRPVTLSLVVRTGGNAQLAVLDASAIAVTVTPPAAVDTTVSGDGKFVTITPRTVFTPDASGHVSIDVSAPYLVGMNRTGLQLSGGSRGGVAHTTLSLQVNDPGATAIDPASTWEVSRLAVPLPTVMPSYNQIGFDSLHYLVGIAEWSGTSGVAWMVGGKLDDQGIASVDPATKAVFPLALQANGATITASAQDGLSVDIMNITLPFSTFRVDARLDPQGHDAVGTASLVGSTKCAGVPMYGQFLEKLGLCNPQTDAISFVAGSNFTWHGAQQAPAGLGTVTFATAGDGVTATLAGSSLVAAQHLASVLLVDDATGAPVTLGYALDTARATAGDGTLASVKIPYAGHAHPAKARAYLMIDTFPAAKATIDLP